MTVDVSGVNGAYAELSDQWKLNQEAYEGSGGFMDGTRLWQFVRESDENYKRRKKRSWYPNAAKSYADTMIGHLFKQPVSRELANNIILEDFVEKTNKVGDVTMSEMMKDASKKAHIYGYSWVVIDKPSETFVSKDAELKEGRAYAFVLKPADVVDWRFDEFGVLLWIKIEETYEPDADNPIIISEPETRYRYWTRDGWLHYSDKGALIAQGEHPIGQVPAVIIVDNKSETYDNLGSTIFSSIAKTAQAQFNKISEKDSILANNTFPILTHPSQKVLARTADDDDETTEANLITIENNMIMHYDPEARHKPEWISIDSSDVESYEKDIQVLSDTMRELAKQNFTTGVASSGVAMAFEFEKTNQTLLDKAGSLKDAERKILSLVSAWMGEELPDDVVIEYATDFNMRDVLRDLDEIDRKLALNIGDRFNKEVKRLAARKLLPKDISETTLNLINQDIENGADLPDLEDFINQDEEE